MIEQQNKANYSYYWSESCLFGARFESFIRLNADFA